ncbi:hypothetical protein AMTR_s00137p00111740 [Amborella trichopoda]|uniref:Uncharacterized protein n=1 Tax=Amborella trichopoda TaxID=13333 RepID=W1NFG5_AMBTC|nr:hypothetical protein AMTR_s00137p00111740 [Amborella trichopoda]
MSEFGVISNSVDAIPTAFKRCYGHVSRSSDSVLVQMNQSLLEAIPTSADDIWTTNRYQLALTLATLFPAWWMSQKCSAGGNDARGLGIVDMLLGIMELKKGGLGLGAICTSVGIIGNGAKLMIF